MENAIGVLGKSRCPSGHANDMEREVRSVQGMAERVHETMSDKMIYLMIYLLACILVGVLVHVELYGVAATVAMLIFVDVLTGLQVEEEARWR